jgi:hypothetical protein
MTISEKAVFQRLKRYYAKQGHVLHRCREDQWFDTTGRYALANEQNHWIDYHVDLEARAREVGVLADHERVEN